MKVLVVGNGGREHALAATLLQSKQVNKVYCIPGNGGTATLTGCENVPFRMDDFEGIARFALVNGVQLVVIGPELPLSLGITDYLQGKGIKVFGPNKAGARIESSKAWAKEIMIKAGVPTAKSQVFTDRDAAIAYIEQEGAPIVVKADGLAAGKGVIVAQTLAEALNGVNELFNQKYTTLVVEEFLEGQEVSVLALTDGITIRPLLPAQDHKRIGDGDTGPNTGGMGAYAPAPLATPELMDKVQFSILQPVIKTLQSQGIDYRGVLYAGLMITPQGEPKVLEFNCRFGDPETQAILPLLDTPLIDLLIACSEQRLGELAPIAWKSEVSTCVVMAAGGYPGNYAKGNVITGLDVAASTGVRVFHAGTQFKNGQVMTDGGRVLGITAIAPDYATAIELAYQGVEAIDFDHKYYRHDIAQRALKTE